MRLPHATAPSHLPVGSRSDPTRHSTAIRERGPQNARFVAAGVAAALLAITGCTTGQPSGGRSAPPGMASPSMAAPSMASTPTTSPPSPAASTGVPSVHEGPLAAGTYRMGQWDTSCSERQPGCSASPAHDSMHVTLTVPDGWAGILGSIVLDDKEDAPPPDGAGLLFGRGAWLLTDPCTKAQHAVPPDIEVGPSVDDFANAIADHPLLDTTDPVDVTLAGYSGKYLDLQVPADISKCGVYRPWDPGIFAQGPSHQWHIWILDVDGSASWSKARTTQGHRRSIARSSRRSWTRSRSCPDPTCKGP